MGLVQTYSNDFRGVLQTLHSHWTAPIRQKGGNCAELLLTSIIASSSNRSPAIAFSVALRADVKYFYYITSDYTFVQAIHSKKHRHEQNRTSHSLQYEDGEEGRRRDETRRRGYYVQEGGLQDRGDADREGAAEGRDGAEGGDGEEELSMSDLVDYADLKELGWDLIPGIEPGSLANRVWCEELTGLFELSNIVRFLRNGRDMILFSAGGGFYLVTEAFSCLILLSRSLQGALDVLRQRTCPEGPWRPLVPYDVTARNITP